MKVRFDPPGIVTDVAPGTTLLKAATACGVEIEAVCGGRGTCGKCRVIATSGLAPLTEAELARLSKEDIDQGYRLACQATVVSDAQVVVPEESRISRVSILSSGVSRVAPLEPWARRYALQVPEATLENQAADLDNLQRCLEKEGLVGLKPTLSALRELPAALRDAGGEVTLLLVDEDIVSMAPGSGPEHVLGVAFDVGTTTVVGYLMDLETGQQLGVASRLNPQTRYGDDVVSRIGYAKQHEDGLETLRRVIVGAMNDIVAQASEVAGVSQKDILAATVAGNTTMHHLFLGLNPEELTMSPYVPVSTSPQRLWAREVGLQIHPEAGVWVLPNIAGWVGGDTVGVILATGIYDEEEPALAIDLGTNGEMALGSRGRLMTCSTAAGPAFEGAHLSCGMRAADGAIDEVSIDHSVTFHAIGTGAPRGVCGSGLVDLVAEMLSAGIIDATGMMQDGESLRHNGNHLLADRITQIGRQRAFVLAPASEGAGGRAVVATQRDIRELQLAKGAIRAGIETLMKELGVAVADVRRVYLAGAFGNYVRPESALAIGLIPHFPNAEIVPVGNAAGSGTKMALVSRSARETACEILDRAEYLELSGRPDFQDLFVEAMIF